MVYSHTYENVWKKWNSNSGVYPILLETIASHDAIMLIADKPKLVCNKIEIIARVAILIAIMLYIPSI